MLWWTLSVDQFNVYNKITQADQILITQRMDCFYIEPKVDYIKSIAKHVLKNHVENIGNLVIILPNGQNCRELQLSIGLQMQNQSSYLPKIVTFDEFIENSGLVMQNISKIDYISEELLMTESLMESHTLNFDFRTSVSTVQNIIELFYDLTKSNVNISALELLALDGQSEYFSKIVNALSEVQENFFSKLRRMNKVCSYEYKKFFFENAKVNNEVIIAGVVPIDKSILKFISRMHNCKFILPSIHLDDIGKFPHIKRFLEHFEIEHSNIFPLDDSFSKQNYSKPKVGYIEFEDEYEEVWAVAHKVAVTTAEFVTKNKNVNISVIAPDVRYAQLLENSLNYFGIYPRIPNGFSLYTSKIGEFLLLISDYISDALSNSFDVQKFISILKSKYVLSGNAYILDNLMRGKFVSNHIDVLNLLRDHLEIAVWYKNILDKITPYAKHISSFKDFVISVISVAESISHEYLWQNDDGVACAKFLEQLMKSNVFTKQLNIKDYNHMFKHMIIKGKFYDSDIDSRVQILDLKNGASASSDYTFILGCSEGSYRSQPDRIIPKKMSEKLGLTSQFFDSIDLCNFYAILNRINVILTRSKNVCNNSTLKLSMLDELSEFYEVVPKDVKKFQGNPVQFNLNFAEKIQPKFPLNISITGVETLISNPYGFYASRILGLKKLDEINPELSIRDFGNIIHDALSLFVSNFSGFTKNIPDTKYIESIIEKVFEKYPKIAEKLWKQKVLNILHAFSEQYKNESKSIVKTYDEIEGISWFEIKNGKKHSLYCIADRIDIRRVGGSIIIDYKTGTMPSSKEVKQGIKPQLILEAIIFDRGGFGKIDYKENFSHKASEVCYVKINIKSPFLEYNSYNIDEKNMQKHIDGFVELLNYYSCVKSIETYVIEPSDKVKYNDYKHLQRL